MTFKGVKNTWLKDVAKPLAISQSVLSIFILVLGVLLCAQFDVCPAYAPVWIPFLALIGASFALTVVGYPYQIPVVVCFYVSAFVSIAGSTVLVYMAAYDLISEIKDANGTKGYLEIACSALLVLVGGIFVGISVVLAIRACTLLLAAKRAESYFPGQVVFMPFTPPVKMEKRFVTRSISTAY